MYAGAEIFVLIYIAWMIFYVIQLFMGFGTAYRWTKKGGNNGVALFGWIFVTGLLAAIPGLGVYMWRKSIKDEENDRQNRQNQNNYPPYGGGFGANGFNNNTNQGQWGNNQQQNWGNNN
ncbi:MAG: hypothetical protein FWE03_06645 [Firmicutes bacterium]|nr:hypothetical protein [Bacillota bacterium]